MAFLDGIKNSLKLDEVAGGMASKLQGAKEFLAEKQQAVTESGPLRMVKEKVGNLVPQGAGAYLSPANWTKYFPAGGGKRQSPIDIITSEARFDESLGDGQFKFQYVASDCIEIENSGYSVQILCSEGSQSTFNAGFLADTFRLRQVHAHCGTEPMNGSEHLIGGVGYAGELHFVHVNTKYTSMEEAMKHPDGLAIIAVFLNESHDDNRYLSPVINSLDRLTYKGDKLPLPHGLDIQRLIPEKMEFWTYEGSLTTPPLAECVIWTIFRGTIPISSNQLDKLRQLYAVGAEDAERNPQRLAGNVRPPQATNGRLVRASFRAGGVVEQPQI